MADKRPKLDNTLHTAAEALSQMMNKPPSGSGNGGGGEAEHPTETESEGLADDDPKDETYDEKSIGGSNTSKNGSHSSSRSTPSERSLRQTSSRLSLKQRSQTNSGNNSSNGAGSPEVKAEDEA